ncbi:MAG: WXG100 family type VII secretion target [Acidimicrobiia bacterium]|nr:WXG100 family type VII secretion target [Acidimicrobiia bacterium]
MAGMVGANLADLDQLQSMFESRAGEVQTLETTLSTRLAPGATSWEGPGADRFRAAWEQEFAPVLRNLREALVQAGSAVAKYRDNIEMATR